MTEHVQTGYLNNDFRTCLAQLMSNGMTSHPRGTTTKELLNYNITLKNARNRVITFPERKTSTRYLLGEFIWYLSGSNDPKGIIPYSRFWDDIRNSDGTVNSNYGHRFFGFHQPSNLNYGPGLVITQWDNVAYILTNDKDSRQAIMNVHLPQDRWKGNKDTPCTLSLQFLIRENALHLIVNLRSNDIILGFCNDVFQFTMLQECMYLELKEVYPDLELGHYFHNAGSMHVYSRHFEMAKKIIANPSAIEIKMAPMDKFNEDIKAALIECESVCVSTGMADDFDFYGVSAWKELTPYWQNLMKAMFLKDVTALNFIFKNRE